MQMTSKISEISDSIVVRVEHNKEIYDFSVSLFGKINFDKFDVFEQINLFWQKQSQEKQLAVFNIYKEIHELLTNIWTNQISAWDREELNRVLTDKIDKLLALHDLKEIRDWLVYDYRVNIPARFEQKYEEPDDYSTTREKTYTRGEYIELITLSLLMRTLIPIFGKYMSLIKKEVGTDFKEFYAYQLIAPLPIARCEAMEKLNIYIENTMKEKDKVSFTNVFRSISSEDFARHMLSLVVVRRLPVSDIRSLDPTANTVTFIYQYVISKLKKSAENEESTIKDKKPKDDGTTGGQEDKISTLEKYRIKVTISLGEVTELEFSVRDVDDVARKLSCEIDSTFLHRCVETSSILINERILDPQMTLLMWVMKPVISPKGIAYLSKPTIVRILGVAQAVLWMRGHKFLSLLATSHAVSSDSVMRIAPIDSKMRVDKELQDRLNQLYPYTRTIVSKKNEATLVNPVNDSIDLLISNLTKCSWRPTADDTLLQEVLGRTSRILPIPPDIKTHITKLLIQTAERSWI